MEKEIARQLAGFARRLTAIGKRVRASEAAKVRAFRAALGGLPVRKATAKTKAKAPRRGR